MAAKLYDKHIFGPVRSRRLGVSLGINLLPIRTKACTFECIYCECGFTPDVHDTLAKKEEVIAQLEVTLKGMRDRGERLDVLTFAGNGEPTFHPDFPEIAAKAGKLRDQYFPEAKISVLSNATMLHKTSVVEALKRVDNNILKLDSGITATALLMDGPRNKSYNIPDIIQQLKQFEGDFIMQTMFLRGTVEGITVDNTTEKEIEAWIQALKETKPKQVMIYSIDRDTPVETLEKVDKEELESIAEKARAEGFFVTVA